MKGELRYGSQLKAMGTSPASPGKSKSARFQHIEYVYYLAVFYSLVNEPYGSTIPYLGTSLIVTIAGLCVLVRLTGLSRLLRSIGLPLLCMVSFVFIQKVFHGESGTGLVPWAVWGAYLIIVQSLFERPNFFFRISSFMFAMGMAVIPYLRLKGVEDRGGLGIGGALGNPNDLADWFGFCAIVFTIRALQASRGLDRFASGIFAFVSLMIVGATVSRGALSALTLATVVGFRSQLKRGFVPVFILVLLAATGFAFGVFDSAISHYANRGIEETGRGTVLKPAFLRFLDSPLVGVGQSNASTMTPEGEKRNPHDSLLYLALVSGIFPLLFFVGYMSFAYYGALHASASHPYLNYLMPLLVYCSFILVVADAIFFMPWFVVTCGACLIEPRRAARAGRLWSNTPNAPLIHGSTVPRLR